MSQLPVNPADLLDRYLDGLLNEQELRTFEAEMSRDAALMAQVDRQRAIDRVLRKDFAPPAVTALTLPATAPAPGTAPAMKFPGGAAGSRRRLGIAATILIALGGLWMYLQNTVYKEQPRIASVNAVYNYLVGSGYVPEWVCEDDREFAESVDNRLGQPLLVASGLPGVEVLGWAYATSDDGEPKHGYNGTPISDKTMILLTRVDGREVVVLVDRLKADRPLELAPGSKLRVHRRELGKLVLYEVSPFDQPRVIDHMFKPDPGNLPPKK